MMSLSPQKKILFSEMFYLKGGERNEPFVEEGRKGGKEKLSHSWREEEGGGGGS